MATIDPDIEAVTNAMAVLMGALNAQGISPIEGIYATSLLTYVACKNNLAMSDSDYMRFCETIMHWGQDLILKPEVKP